MENGEWRMENYLAGVGVQPLGCFELPVQAVFPLRTPKRELQRSNRRSTANRPRYSCVFVCIRVHSWFTNAKCRERLRPNDLARTCLALPTRKVLFWTEAVEP